MVTDCGCWLLSILGIGVNQCQHLRVLLVYFLVSLNSFWFAFHTN